MKETKTIYSKEGVALVMPTKEDEETKMWRQISANYLFDMIIKYAATISKDSEVEER